MTKSKLSTQDQMHQAYKEMQMENLLDEFAGRDLSVTSPIDGKELAALKAHQTEEIESMTARARQAFSQWRTVPAPLRGQLVRILGDLVRKSKQPLAALVSLESGKILTESLGEIQEVVDIFEYATGLSRKIAGLTLPSERPMHLLEERWHPLGPVAIITAFNFPAAVWAWNAALALICGNSLLWKPSEKTPLVAIALNQLFKRAFEQLKQQLPGKSASIKASELSQVILGQSRQGQALVAQKTIPLVCATGSCQMGAKVALEVAKTVGRRHLLELGGNNAMIITEKANTEIALDSLLFGAIGTCGQRCTTTRRAFVHQTIYQDFLTQLRGRYLKLDKNQEIYGHPLEATTTIGPLHSQHSFQEMQQVLQEAREAGFKVTGGTRIFPLAQSNQADQTDQTSFYVTPALVEMGKSAQTEWVKRETFAPILSIFSYDDLDQAIEANNCVSQGLSASIITDDIHQAQTFIHNVDTGLANVNISTSGAEIGGAFGGEKATGGGRESGSDSWKQYMRRSTNTWYYGRSRPKLAQGMDSLNF